MTADPMDMAPEVTIWADVEHVCLVERVLAQMGPAIQVIGLAGPRHGEIDRLARQLNCPHEDDVRRLVVERPAAYVLVASMAGATMADVRTALEQGSILLALEPIVASFDDLARLTHRPASGAEGGDIISLPAFRRSTGWLQAADPSDVLGKPSLLAMESLGGTRDVSLLARLIDVWQTLLTLAPLPIAIDASLSGPLAEMPDDPRAMTGTIAAHARMSDNCSAVVQVSDRSGLACRSLHVLGEGAQFRVNDHGYTLHDAAGHLLDQHEPTTEDRTTSFAQMVAQEWRWLLSRSSGAPLIPEMDGVLVRDDAVLACCQACQLSARTGEPESPQKLLDLHRG